MCQYIINGFTWSETRNAFTICVTYQGMDDDYLLSSHVSSPVTDGPQISPLLLQTTRGNQNSSSSSYTISVTTLYLSFYEVLILCGTCTVFLSCRYRQFCPYFKMEARRKASVQRRDKQEQYENYRQRPARFSEFIARDIKRLTDMIHYGLAENPPAINRQREWLASPA